MSVEIDINNGLGGSLNNPLHWHDTTLVSFLRDHGVTSRPMPARSVLVKIASELITFKSKCLPIIRRVEHGTEPNSETKTDVEPGSGAARRRPLINSQTSIPKRLNPFELDSWTGSISLQFIFAYYSNRIVCAEFKALQNAVLTIALSIDQHDALAKVLRIFVMQDLAQTQAVCIIALGALDLDGVPLVILRYFSATREDHNLMLRLLKTLPLTTIMQDVLCELVAVKMMKRLLQRNRKRLQHKGVKNMEKRWKGAWHVSALLPISQDGVKCSSCSALGTWRCSRCKKQAYCSSKCQKWHWNVHKAICKKRDK